MAKSLRASSRKRNNAALRSKLYRPASDARTERLSAKLQELASKPRPDQERAMDVDDMPAEQKEAEDDVAQANGAEGMLAGYVLHGW
jgi:outer membrane murein-binding lipoprotein Lpp